jgi:hypothetical protein
VAPRLLRGRVNGVNTASSRVGRGTGASSGVLVETVAARVARVTGVSGHRGTDRGELGDARAASGNTAAGSASGDTGEIDDHVHVVDEIARAVEGDLSGGTERNLGVEVLLDGLHGKVGVLVVAGTPVRDVGVEREVDVRSTERHQFSRGTAERSTNASRSRISTGHFYEKFSKRKVFFFFGFLIFIPGKKKILKFFAVPNFFFFESFLTFFIFSHFFFPFSFFLHLVIIQIEEEHLMLLLFGRIVPFCSIDNLKFQTRSKIKPQ